MSGGREAVYPGLYPDVVSSVPFALDLSEVVLPTGIKDEETMALKQILGKHTSRPWWSVIMGFPSRIAAMFDNSADVEPKLSTKASVGACWSCEFTRQCCCRSKNAADKYNSDNAGCACSSQSC